MEAPKKYPCPVACASQWRQPSLFGGDTHAVTTHEVWSQCVGGLRAWPIETCSNKDAGKSEKKTPTPCGREQADTGSSRVLTTKHSGMQMVGGLRTLEICGGSLT